MFLFHINELVSERGDTRLYRAIYYLCLNNRLQRNQLLVSERWNMRLSENFYCLNEGTWAYYRTIYCYCLNDGTWGYYRKIYCYCPNDGTWGNCREIYFYCLNEGHWVITEKSTAEWKVNLTIQAWKILETPKTFRLFICQIVYDLLIGVFIIQPTKPCP